MGEPKKKASGANIPEAQRGTEAIKLRLPADVAGQLRERAVGWDMSLSDYVTRLVLADSRCNRCKEPAAAGHVLCTHHLEIERNDIKRMYDARRERGLCIRCKKPVVDGKSLCQVHLDYERDRKRMSRA